MPRPPAPPISRRDVLRAAAFTGGALTFGASAFASPARRNPGKLRLGVVGVANRGRANLDAVQGEDIVALCDVDGRFLNAALERFPAARGYADFRRMLEEEELDGVVCSTPDHTHSTVTLAALERGLPVYCEKPLTRTVGEARRVRAAARAANVATQMGIQIHAGDNYRRAVWIVQSGALGDVREVYVWCGKGWWAPKLPDVPADAKVPEHLDWDLWTGPAERIAYRPKLHPADWRRYWAYGGGTLADMACHYMDLPFWALGLHATAPTSIEAEGPEPSATGAPQWLHVRLAFPKGDVPVEHQAAPVERGPVALHWYDGGRRPEILAELGIDWGSGVLFVGDKGMLLADYGRRVLLPKTDFADYVEPDHRGLVLPSAAGAGAPERRIPQAPPGHHAEWLDAIRSGSDGARPTGANFEYASALTEAVLLGAAAYRAGTPLVWDGGAGLAKAPGGAEVPGLDALLDPAPREGWRA